MLQGEHARLLVQRAYTNINQGELVDTYARSAFEDTRRKAAKFGAMGSTIRAMKPELSGPTPLFARQDRSVRTADADRSSS